MHPNPRIYIKHHQTLCCQSLCHPHRNWSSLAIPSGPEPSRTLSQGFPAHVGGQVPKKVGKDGGVFFAFPRHKARAQIYSSQIQVLNGQTENVWRNPSRHGVQHIGNQTWTISDRFAEDLTLSYSLLLMSDNRNLFQMSAFEGPGRPQRLWCKGVYFGITLVVQIMRTQHEQHLFSFYSKLCLCKTTFEDVAVSKLLQIHSGLCPKNPWLVPKKNPGTARWFARLTAFCRAQQDGHQHS